MRAGKKLKEFIFCSKQHLASSLSQERTGFFSERKNLNQNQKLKSQKRKRARSKLMEADQPKRFGTIFTKNIAISSNTKLFRLDFKKGESFNFLAGQFVMIARKTEEGKEVKRAYSFCSPPYEKGYTEYCVKIVSGGAISEWFDKLPLNTEVEIIGPYGKFVVTDFSKDIL